MNFVFDIDGTLCFDGKTIDDSITNALNELVKDGHNVIFASARPIRDLVPVLPPEFKKGALVGGNGCFIAQNENITATHFTPTLMKQLFTHVNDHQLTYLADGEWDFAFTGDIDHPIYKNIDQSSAKKVEITALKKVCKLVLFKPTSEIIHTLSQLPVNITAYKSEDAIDISPLGINKVSGLKKLGVHDFIAFGNDSNDQCLFEKARYSVCVGDNDVYQYATTRISKEQVAQTILQFKNTHLRLTL